MGPNGMDRRGPASKLITSKIGRPFTRVGQPFYVAVFQYSD